MDKKKKNQARASFVNNATLLQRNTRENLVLEYSQVDTAFRSRTKVLWVKRELNKRWFLAFTYSFNRSVTFRFSLSVPRGLDFPRNHDKSIGAPPPPMLNIDAESPWRAIIRNS